MASKKKPKGPNFIADGQPRMSCEEKDCLFIHMFRRRRVFEEALAQLPQGTLTDEDQKYKLLLTAYRNLAKLQARPGDKHFRGLLKDEVRKIVQNLDEDSSEVEVAKEVTDAGGFIDEAYAAAKADLSDERGHALLKRFLYEVTVVHPLEKLFQECSYFHQIPANLPEVVEKIHERLRKQEGIDTKAVNTFAEEWDEHEARLKHYRGKKMIGLKTGLPELDRRTLGLRGLFVFGAKPGAGKTTYAAVAVAIGVCRHYADNDCVVIVVSLDMDRYDLYRRMHCHLGRIEWVPLMFGSPEDEREPGSMFSKADKKRLQDAKQRLKEWKVGERLAIADRPVLGEDVTAHRLSAIIEEQKAKVGAKRALVIIDYLQLIPVPEEETARGDLAADKYRIRLVQQVIERSRTADDPLGDTALVISETRKPPTKEDNWGDSMSELMGSARLSYASDAVILYREMSTKEMETYYGIKDKTGAEKKRKALRGEGITPVTLILDKGRDGMMRGTWGAEFLFRKSAFRELLPNQHMLASAPPPPDDPDEDEQPAAPGHGTSTNGHLALPPGNGLQAKPKKKGKKASPSTQSGGSHAKPSPAGKANKKHPK